MGLIISKQEMRKLPTETFDGEIIVIDKVKDVADAVAYLKQFKVIGFDTETKPVFRKNTFNKVALMQLSTLEKCFLFRLNIIKFPDELDDLICSNDVKKIGLSLRDDFASLRERSNCTPLNFIDLQTIVKDYGIKELSLQKIHAILFNKRISKSQRLSNWEARTLKKSQQMYASIDAWACLKIYNHLIKNGAPTKAK